LEREDGDKKVAHNIATFLFFAYLNKNQIIQYLCLNNDDRKKV